MAALSVASQGCLLEVGLRLLVCILALLLAWPAAAFEIEGLQPVGPYQSHNQQGHVLLVKGQDGCQIKLDFLAPDLVRVHYAFRGQFPPDHSWAVARTDWPGESFTVQDEPGRLVMVGSKLKVVVNKSPLCVEFQDRSGRVLNRDNRPVLWDARGVRKKDLFDPESGPMVAVCKDLGLEEHFYGLGEKAHRLDKRRGHFTMWNSDTPKWKEGTDPIYQSIPFYMGLEDGKAYGLFYDNSYKSYFDFGSSTQEWAGWMAEGGQVDYYFFAGPDMKTILNRYTELTGRMPLPPKWALGHQACRWSYYPEKMVEQIVATYQAHDLPLDVITLDIDYMQKYRVFTWDLSRFPDPKAMIERFRKQGVRTVCIIDPGVKYQPGGAVKTEERPEIQDQSKGYYVFNEGVAKNLFVKRKSGELLVTAVWPGDSVFVDWTLEAARKWWGDLHRAYLDYGVAGIWNDMNEPADFKEQTGANQRDSIFDDHGQKTGHAKNRNVFAFLMDRATYEGLQRLRPNERPYVITRAAFAGIQRYATMWTGDAATSWEGLSVSLPVYMTLGLSGEAFIGSDVGGFMGRADGELMARAYQIGFLVPFCRNHKDISSYDQEPWRYGPYYEGIIRKYLKLRYRLLPYMYGLLAEAHQKGIAPLRPLVLEYPSDPQVPNLDDEMMLGSDLLAAPVLKPDMESRRVYLPAGRWYDFWTERAHEGGAMIRAAAPLETVPLFTRGGSILPLGAEANTVDAASAGPLELRIYPDANAQASTTLYEDDGATPAYLKGAYSIRSVRFDRGQVMLSERKGDYTPPQRTLTLHCPGYTDQTIPDESGARTVTLQPR